MKESRYKEQLEYCLQCKNKPCQKACPLENDIPSVIDYMKKQDDQKAYSILEKTTVLSSVCGRICPQKRQCEGSCTRGINSIPVCIGQIEAYLGDKFLEQSFSMISNDLVGKKIAVVGSGPAGLTCSAFLARHGAKVSLYEKQEKLGGLLCYGIPNFRLDSKIVQKNIHKILKLGITPYCNFSLKTKEQLTKLQEQYDAVFLAIGANCSVKMGLQGENLQGVYGGNELLQTNHHPNYIRKKVVIIGGGNVAIDVARTIKKLGAKEVLILYRRTKRQMPAEQKEIEAAEKEGIILKEEYMVTKILGKEGKVTKIEYCQTKQQEGIPLLLEQTKKERKVDYVVMAIGSKPEKEIIMNLGLATNEKGYLVLDKEYQTSKERVFAAGDLIGTKSTVAWAARSGREAANYIKEYLLRKDLLYR